MSLKIRVKVMKWDSERGERVPTLVELEFANASNEAELREALQRVINAKRQEREIDSLDEELSSEAIGINTYGIRQAYYEDTHRGGRGGGGGEATGSRKTMRECRAREKGRSEEKGGWDMNL